MKTLILSLLILSSFNYIGCVSVNIGPGDSERADDVEFKEPPEPFDDEDAGDVDEGWKNPKNGNSISFISDCGSKQDPSLENIRDGVLNTLNSPEVISEDRKDYNGRAALRTEAKGKVDGVETHLDLMVFKKSNCIFILTYVGLPDSFKVDRSHFNNFLQGFKAQ